MLLRSDFVVTGIRHTILAKSKAQYVNDFFDFISLKLFLIIIYDFLYKSSLACSSKGIRGYWLASLVEIWGYLNPNPLSYRVLIAKKLPQKSKIDS